MSSVEDSLRHQLTETAVRLGHSGLNRGTSGNVSVRCGDSYLMTPSGVHYDRLEPAMAVRVSSSGEWSGDLAPTSEWRLHLGIHQARPEITAVVHTHSDFATALACRRLEIPAFHYMVAIAGGSSIRCAPYAKFGTARLAELAVEAMRDRRACLLAHHGTIAVGPDLRSAFDLAEEVEGLARQYCQVLSLGAPVLLSDQEMREVAESFGHYFGG